MKRCLLEREPVSLPDWPAGQLTDAERKVCEARGLRSLLFVPVLVGEDSVGAFIVGSVGRVHAFGGADVDVCGALSHAIGLALANARLHASLQRSHEALAQAYDATLEGWSMAHEMRDDETQGHALRVATLRWSWVARSACPRSSCTCAAARCCTTSARWWCPTRSSEQAGPAHRGEWVVMRQHPENAAASSSRIAYLAPALDIPYCHHERWDGTGYPRGIAAPRSRSRRASSRSPMSSTRSPRTAPTARLVATAGA